MLLAQQPKRARGKPGGDGDLIADGA